MGLIELLIGFLGNNAALISFLGSLIIGEEVLVLMSILAGKGLVPIWIIFVYGFLGSLIGDLFWFYIGKSRIIDWLRGIKFVRKSYNHSRPLLEKLAVKEMHGWKCLLYFGFSKFMGVIKVLAVVYAARRGMSFSRFMKWNIPALILWMIPMLFAGWLAGRGFVLLLHILKNLQLALGAMVILGIILYIAFRWGAELIIKRSLRKTKAKG
jgi:undecaprenyl-diphosphatase